MYGKNLVGGTEHNLPERNLLVTDAQDDSFVRAQAFKIVQILSVNRDQHCTLDSQPSTIRFDCCTAFREETT